MTGLNEDFMETVRGYAREHGLTLRQLYGEAIEELCDRLDRGDRVLFLSTEIGTGSKGRHIRVTDNIFDRWIEVAGSRKVHQSAFFVRALRDYLEARDVELADLVQ